MSIAAPRVVVILAWVTSISNSDIAESIIWSKPIRSSAWISISVWFSSDWLLMYTLCGNWSAISCQSKSSRLALLIGSEYEKLSSWSPDVSSFSICFFLFIDVTGSKLVVQTLKISKTTSSPREKNSAEMIFIFCAQFYCQFYL